MTAISNTHDPNPEWSNTMKSHHIATGILVGLATAVIAAAPIASAANPSTTTNGGRATTTEKQGHAAIVVHPPTISPPSSYGPFSSSVPILMFD
jgi:hypothetical protein